MFASRMIVVDLQTFQQGRASGIVTGVICVELESGAFPDAGWSDFPVIILSWWVEALFQLETPTRLEVLWRFMDGPQGLTLTKVTGDTGEPTFEQVERYLLEAAQRVVSHCEQHKMLNRDLEMLRVNAGRLAVNQAAQRTGASRSAHIEIRPSLATGSGR